MPAAGNESVTLEFVEDVKQEKAVKPKKAHRPEPKAKPELAPWVVAGKATSKGSVAKTIQWWFYMTFKLYNYEWITPPSMYGNIAAETRDNEQFVSDHSRVSYVTSVASSGYETTKTTVIDILGAYTNNVLKCNAGLLGLYIDGDRTVSRFHKQEGAILSATTLIRFLKEGSKFTAKQLVSYTDSDDESKLVLYKAKAENDRVTRDLSREDTSMLVRYMVHIHPVLHCDSGPGLNSMATEGILEASDIVMIPQKSISTEATDDVRKVIMHPQYNLETRIDRVIVVISGVTRRQLNTRTQDAVAKRCGVAFENVILIPYDRYLDAHRSVNLRRVSIPALKPKTRLMYSRLLKQHIVIAPTRKRAPNP
jgi:hypothetical protein